jgi:hypothetical protein
MNTQEIMDKMEQRAEQRAQRSIVLRQLRRKFGELPEHVMARVQAADTDTLDRYTDKLLFANSLDEVISDES